MKRSHLVLPPVACVLAVLSPGCARDPEPVRKQRDAKVQILKSDIEKVVADLRDRFTACSNTPTPDALLATLKQARDDMRAQGTRLRAMMDELTAFLDQNKDFEEKLGFAETRSWVERARGQMEANTRELERAINGTKDVRVNVNSGLGEWQGVGVSAKAGDVVAYESLGQWSMGPFAGTCGPSGFTNGDFAKYAVYRFPCGALLLRVGEGGNVFVAAGQGLMPVTGDGGQVSARCNDRDCSNNKGLVSLRVVMVPFSK